MKQMIPLFKFFIKKNWKILGIFALLVGLYGGVIAFMATDTMMVEAMGFLNMESAVAAVGSEAALAMNITLAVFQGMIMFIFVMVFYVLLNHKLLYKAVDTTSLNSILSTPVSRKQYIITAYIFMVVCIFALYLLAFLLLTAALLTYSGSFSWVGLISVHITAFLCTLAVASISFACSAIFAGSRSGMLMLAGIPIAFAAIMMLATYLSFFQYFTPFMWADVLAQGKASGFLQLASRNFNLWWLLDLIYIVIIAASFIAALFVFDKKQLSI